MLETCDWKAPKHNQKEKHYVTANTQGKLSTVRGLERYRSRSHFQALADLVDQTLPNISQDVYSEL